MRLPDDTKRLAIVGTTGSGKSHAACWHLSKRSWDKKPWIVFDPKYDELLGAIDGARHIEMNELPKHPGIYLVHNLPGDMEAVIALMWRIYSRENTGVYIDEGYMVSGGGNSNPALRALLTQGRSKHIPVIIISQRPVWMDRFVFSESEFIQAFRLNDARDRASVRAFMPVDMDAENPLPEFHSYYFDVGRNEVVVLRPVPDRDAILDAFEVRFSAMQEKRRIFI